MKRHFLIIAYIFLVFLPSVEAQTKTKSSALARDNIRVHLGNFIEKSNNAAFTSTISALLQAGMKPEEFTSLLGIAAINDNIFFLDFLLAIGCDINDTNEHGQTIAIFFVERSKPKPELTESRLKELIHLGLLIDTPDKNGFQALHSAAVNDRADIILYLGHIQRINIDARGGNGETSLMLAARFGAIEAAKALLEVGADVSLKDNDSKTALDWAKLGSTADGFGDSQDNRRKSEQIISLLKSAQKKD